MIYWLIFFSWILYSYFIKKGSQHHLWIAFSLFFLAALLKITSFDKLAETLMKISLLGWFIGMIIAIKEYRRN